MATLVRQKTYVGERPYQELELDNIRMNSWIDILEEKVRKYEQDPKSAVEFNRYKQDCRKRALEMAHNELVAGMQPNAKVSVGMGLNVVGLADKYYNWLISIPE